MIMENYTHYNEVVNSFDELREVIIKKIYEYTNLNIDGTSAYTKEWLEKQTIYELFTIFKSYRNSAFLRIFENFDSYLELKQVDVIKIDKSFQFIEKKLKIYNLEKRDNVWGYTYKRHKEAECEWSDFSNFPLYDLSLIYHHVKFHSYYFNKKDEITPLYI